MKDVVRTSELSLQILKSKYEKLNKDYVSMIE